MNRGSAPKATVPVRTAEYARGADTVTYRFSVLGSIADIDAAAWDALAGDAVLMSHGWLRTAEQTLERFKAPRYILLSRNGHLAGASVCHRVDAIPGRADLDDVVFGRLKRPLRRAGITCLPALVCGTPMGYAPHLLTAADLDAQQRVAVADALLEAVETMAAAEALPVVFARVTRDSGDLYRRLTRRGFLASQALPEARLELGFQSFTEYRQAVGKVSRHMKRHIPREINRNRRSGVSIVPVDDWPCVEAQFHRILDAAYQRYNQTPFPYDRSVFDRIAANLPHRYRAYAAFKNGRLVGGSVFLIKNRSVYAFALGVDHAAAGNDFTYFNCGYYHPIREALIAGWKTIHYGNQAYEAKLRRGCRLVEARLFVKPVSRASRLAARPFFRLHRYWCHRKLPEAVKHRLAAFAASNGASADEWRS